MGWKNVRDWFEIRHTVQVTPEGICIGSPYIHNIIVIGPDGTVLKPYRSSSNEDLKRYQREFDADPESLRRMVTGADSFEKSIPVYTYRGGEVVEKACEALGWPNVTHDGEMMHDNTFSPVKLQVVTWAKENAADRVRWAARNAADAQKRLDESRETLASAEADLEKLEKDYPMETTRPDTEGQEEDPREEGHGDHCAYLDGDGCTCGLFDRIDEYDAAQAAETTGGDTPATPQEGE